MPITPASIAVGAGIELQAMFRDGLSVLGAGEPQYLVDGEPESVTGAISQAAGRSACRIYGTGNIDLPPAAAERYERVCRPYLNTISPGRAPRIVPQGVGGQCVGVPYSFWTQQKLPGSETEIRRIFDCSAGWYGPLGVRTDTPSPGFEKIFITGRNASGSFREASSSFTGPGGSIRFENVIRCDAGSENCGNPPPQITLPRPIPNPTGPTFNFNPNVNINVPITVNLNPNGTFIFNIGTGPITIDPFTGNPFDPGGGGGGGGDGGGGGGGPTDGPVGDPGTPGTPVETDEDGEAEEEAPPDSVLVGLVIEILESPPGASEFKPGVFRGAAYIYMGTPGALDQDFGGSMIRSGQFFFAEKDNLTVWEVNANVGFRLRVTPYYREVD